MQHAGNRQDGQAFVDLESGEDVPGKQREVHVHDAVGPSSFLPVERKELAKPFPRSAVATDFSARGRTRSANQRCSIDSRQVSPSHPQSRPASKPDTLRPGGALLQLSLVHPCTGRSNRRAADAIVDDAPEAEKYAAQSQCPYATAFRSARGSWRSQPLRKQKTRPSKLQGPHATLTSHDHATSRCLVLVP